LAVLVAVAVTVSAFSVPEGYVLTPFGARPKGCVVEVPSGAHISEVAEGVKIVYEVDGATREHIVIPPKECHEDDVIAKYLAINQRRKAQVDAFPINGWLDNAGWYPPATQSDLDSFVSTYTTPGDPASDSGQVLFFFIGMQDNDDPNAVNIIQPVLTWGNGVKGWNLASWDCCPKNITVQSQTIVGIKAGDQILGTLKRYDSSTWIIDSKVTTGTQAGKNTTLYSHVGNYIYNWADVTQEVYSVINCNQFATGPMKFTGLTLKDNKQELLTPAWQKTGTTDCNGHLTQDTTVPTTITIQHN